MLEKQLFKFNFDMSKKIKAFVKLALPAGKATPAPPVGPALGQHGVNISFFCKEYNAKTSDKVGMIIPAKITIYEDKSFFFILKTPPTSSLLLKYSGLKKGSSKKTTTSSITMAQLKEIALLKLKDLNTTNIDKAIQIISGTAKNMGIKICD